MGYQRPCGNVYISDTWQGHLDRHPPSSEPGTDYAVAIGRPVHAAGVGTVVDFKTTNSYATGRYVTVRLDDGRTVRYLHLQAVSVWNGLERRAATSWASQARRRTARLRCRRPRPHDALAGRSVAGTHDRLRAVRRRRPEGNHHDEEDDDMPKNRGFNYTRSSDNRTDLVRDQGERALHGVGRLDDPPYNPIAAAFDTGPCARVTQGPRDAMKELLDAVQAPSAPATSTTFSMSWWVVGLIGVVLVAELVLGVLLGVLPR